MAAIVTTASAVVTAASTVTCGHFGTVMTVGTPKLTVGKSPVLLESGIAGQPVGDPSKPATLCQIVPTSSPVSTKCTQVKTVTNPPSLSTKLLVSGHPVVLATLKGTTDGEVSGVTPQTLLGATVTQTLLTAT